MSHHRSRALLLLSAFLYLASCTSLLRQGYTTELVSLKPGSYKLDLAHSTVLFKIDHFGISKYIGRFNTFDATLEFDPEDVESSRLHAVVDTASIDVEDEDFSKTLAGSDWFDSERFPQAVFSTQSAKFVEGGDVVFSGNLQLLGESQPVDVSIRFNGGATNALTGYYTIGFSASAMLMRSSFGMDKHIGLVGDEVELEIHAEFQKTRR